MTAKWLTFNNTNKQTFVTTVKYSHITGNTLTVSVSTGTSDEDDVDVVTHHSCSYYLSILKLVSKQALIIKLFSCSSQLSLIFQMLIITEIA